MALDGFVSFETGDLGEAAAVTQTLSSTVTINTTHPHSGNYACLVSTTGAGLASYQLGNYGSDGTISALGYTSGTTVYIRFYVYVQSNPGSVSYDEFFSVLAGGASSSADLALRCNGQDKIGLWLNASNPYTSAGGFFPDGASYKIEIQFTAGSSGTIELKINDAVVYSASGTVGSGGVTGIFLGKNFDISATSYEYIFDDVAWSSSSAPGDGAGSLWLPSGAGAAGSGWSGTYADIDEVPNDGDTSYVSTTSGLTATENYLISSAIASGATIQGLKVVAYAKRNGGTQNFKPGVRISGTTYTPASYASAVGASYAAFGAFWATNPNTSVAWTIDDINFTQAFVGNEIGQSGELRVTAVYILVANSILQDIGSHPTISSPARFPRKQPKQAITTMSLRYTMPLPPPPPNVVGWPREYYLDRD